MMIKEVEYDEDGNIIIKTDADSEEYDSDQEVRETEEEEKDSVTEVDISGSDEAYQYSQLVAAELDSGQQLQLLNNSLNTLIIIVFLSVVLKILFRIVDEIF